MSDDTANLARSMDDGDAVSAVVLTLGEPTTARALESVRRQSSPVADVVVVEGVSPFHRALNEGASRVRTPFFVQVDADMVLDDDCVETLRARAASHVGLVVGQLRDPLYTRIHGVKLFRTACFAWGGLPDTVSPDTDFLDDLERRGWTTVFALRYERTPDLWHTFGEHLPTYDEPLYTYRKFSVEGRRWSYRGDAGALRHHLATLGRSAHRAALLAEISLANGVFLEDDGDLLQPYSGDAGYTRLVRLLTGESRPPAGSGGATRWVSSPASWLSAKAAFRCAYTLGVELGRDGRRDRVDTTLKQLHSSVHPFDWLLQIGLCRGLLAERYDRTILEEDWRRLAVFRSYYDLRGVWQRLVARARDEIRRARLRRGRG